MKQHILSLLAVVVLAVFVAAGSIALQARRKTKVRDSWAAIAGIRNALVEYHDLHGQYPVSRGPVCRILPALMPFIKVSYDECDKRTISVDLIGTDGWGNDIQYLSSGKSYVAWSIGADGRPDQPPVAGFFSDPARDIIFYNGCEWSEPHGLHVNVCRGVIPNPIALVEAEISDGGTR